MALTTVRLTQGMKCAGMPPHETWDWTEQDGWLHQPSFWGDTAKWFLRIDAPSTSFKRLFRSTIHKWKIRTSTHKAHCVGVREDHTYNLIQSGRNWFGARLSALGSSTASWNILFPTLWLEGT